MAAGLAAEPTAPPAGAPSAPPGHRDHHPPAAPVAPGAFTLDQPVAAPAPAVSASDRPGPESQPELSRRAARPRLSLPPLPVAAPHVKTHHYCVTPDGWRLHLVRTRAASGPAPGGPGSSPPAPPPEAASSASSSASCTTQPSQHPQSFSQHTSEQLLSQQAQPPPPPQQQQQQQPTLLPLSPRRCPVVLVPGLGSSGAYTFDLSPVVSLADYLAARGWDVWVVELRGNGQSDRPSLWSGRSRWWSIDDYVTKDLPAVLRHVLRTTCCAQAHLVGHSMGGMVLTRLLALGGEPAAGVASATVVASGCFLKGSWWQMLESTMWMARYLWIVPAGSTLRAYSPLALGRAGLPLLDELYFWPPNTDPALARAVLARNFSAISSGVILQIKSAFGPSGLRTADGKEAYADPDRLARVETPVLFVCGDRDRMCPPEGAAATAALFRGSRCRRYVELGPAEPPPGHTRTHYGHFDILMGRNAEEEVFPLLSDWLEEQDGDPADEAAAAAAAAASARSKKAAAAGASGRHPQQPHPHHPSHPPHHPAHPRHHSQHPHPHPQHEQHEGHEGQRSSSHGGSGASASGTEAATAAAAADGLKHTAADRGKVAQPPSVAVAAVPGRVPSRGTATTTHTSEVAAAAAVPFPVIRSRL